MGYILNILKRKCYYVMLYLARVLSKVINQSWIIAKIVGDFNHFKQKQYTDLKKEENDEKTVDFYWEQKARRNKYYSI